MQQKIPAAAPQGPSKRENSSFFFTQYVTGGKKVRVWLSAGVQLGAAYWWSADVPGGL